MRFYSDVTKQVYDTEELLKEAESKEEHKLAKIKLEKEERANEAKKVEKLFKEASDKYDEAYKALNEFCKKYGSFHTTIDGNTLSTKTMLNSFFRDWLLF